METQLFGIVVITVLNKLLANISYNLFIGLNCLEEKLYLTLLLEYQDEYFTPEILKSIILKKIFWSVRTETFGSYTSQSTNKNDKWNEWV